MEPIWREGAVPASPAPDPSWTGALERLLDLARDELGADVEVLPSQAHVGRRPGGAIDVPLVRADGHARGALRIRPNAGTTGFPADDRTVRLLARLVAEQLDAADAARSTWSARLDAIEQILARRELRLVFQPIVDLRSGETVGVEGLARFPQPPQLSPDHWFRQAASVGRGVQLELLALSNGIATIDQLPEDVYLSVNVSPEVAVSAELARAVRDAPLHRLVLEITEHAEVADYEAVNRALGPLRDEGLRVAVDDAGAGFASLRHILQMSPDIIKLDISLTHDIDHNSVLRALSYSLTAFASAIDASVVAEGIENERELQALRFLGVAYGQGFFLRPPGPLPLSGDLPEGVFNLSTPA